MSERESRPMIRIAGPFILMCIAGGVVAAAPADDAMSTPCTGRVDGLYCSVSLGLSASSTLFRCESGKMFTEVACPNACEASTEGTPDRCRPLARCPGGDGLYCAASLGFPFDGCNPTPFPYCNLSIINDTLYRCVGGVITQAAICPSSGSNGCQAMPGGQPDRCRAGLDDSGDGFYCGKGANIDAPPDTDPSVLYSVSGTAWTRFEDCANGCQRAPEGQPDFCK